MIKITEEMSQDMFSLSLKIEANQEYIESVKKKIMLVT